VQAIADRSPVLGSTLSDAIHTGRFLDLISGSLSD
jgi:hypothetical protein